MSKMFYYWIGVVTSAAVILVLQVLLRRFLI